MALKKITMQDIADACGLSRNTVSKVFNDRGNVPESTRQMVLEKAPNELSPYTGTEPSGRPKPKHRTVHPMHAGAEPLRV